MIICMRMVIEKQQLYVVSGFTKQRLRSCIIPTSLPSYLHVLVQVHVDSSCIT